MTRTCIFVTGISGSGAGQYISNIRKVRKDIQIFDVGKTMFELAKQLGITIPEEKVLDKPDSELAPLRATAFEYIISESKKFENFVVRSHACFRWKKNLRKAFDLHYLRKLEPNFFINITDSLLDIYWRLSQNPQWSDQISLKEIIMWREEEMLLTELMASYQQRPVYIIPYREPVETLVKIVFSKEKKAYLSYPISHMKLHIERWLAQKDKYRDKLRKHMIVIDPLDVKDVELVGKAREAYRKRDRKFTLPEYRDLEMDVQEVLDLEQDIYFQTPHRDFKLIDQSDMVVTLYPEPVKSQGVAEEIKYARSTSNKDVFMITNLPLDPFTMYNVTKTYPTIEEFVEKEITRKRRR